MTKEADLQQNLDDEIDGLIGKIADGSVAAAELARYNELTLARIKASTFTREMARETRRRFAFGK